MYGSDSSDSDSDSAGGDGRRQRQRRSSGSGSDSDAELEAAIRRRRHEFVAREREILARLQQEQEQEQGGGGELAATHGERRYVPQAVRRPTLCAAGDIGPLAQAPGRNAVLLLRALLSTVRWRHCVTAFSGCCNGRFAPISMQKSTNVFKL